MIHIIDDRGFGRGRGRGPPGRRPPPPGGRPGRRPNNNNNGFTGPFGGNLGTVATAGTERVTLLLSFEWQINNEWRQIITKTSSGAAGFAGGLVAQPAANFVGGLLGWSGDCPLQNVKYTPDIIWRTTISRLCPPNYEVVRVTQRKLKKDKVNTCLARYNPRATTTNQSTNRAPNEPAQNEQKYQFWAKNPNFSWRNQKFCYPHNSKPTEAPSSNWFLVGHSTKCAKNGNIWPKMNKNANFGQKILFFPG